MKRCPLRGRLLIACGVILAAVHPLVAAQPDNAPTWLLSWEQKGSEPGKFNAPIGIAIDRSDHVFVTDLRNQRVQQFDAQGQFISTFKVAGQPGGIARDPEGLLYVSLFDKHRVVVSLYEIVPIYLPRRTFDPFDIIASFLGAIFSILLASILFLMQRKNEHTLEPGDAR